MIITWNIQATRNLINVFANHTIIENFISLKVLIMDVKILVKMLIRESHYRAVLIKYIYNL